MGVCTLVSLEFIVVTMEIGYKCLLFLKSDLSVVSFYFKKKLQQYCGWEYELLGK